eukprot:3933734-Rhodomonas_salina.2
MSHTIPCSEVPQGYGYFARRRLRWYQVRTESGTRVCSRAQSTRSGDGLQPRGRIFYPLDGGQGRAGP